ncbi:MAG: hypothetical protein NTV86_21440 [Planctomycetota bacterium]|nr:hypothetical protein [Planctomycetota bacterium]
MKRSMLWLAVWALGVLLTGTGASGQVMDVTSSFTWYALSQTYTQDFNGADFAAPTALPGGWTFRERGTNVNTIDGQFTDSPGQSNTSNARRFRFDQTPGEAAFGTQRSASDSPDSAEQWIGFGFTNGCPDAITALAIQYTGETWRVAVANRCDGLLFEYSLDATALNNGTWVSAPALNYFNPGGAVTNGSFGNVTSATVSGTVSGLFLSPGASMMIRWSDYDSPVAGREDGIGVDDLDVAPALLLTGDFNRDGEVGPEDFGILKDGFGLDNLAHGHHESWTLGDGNDDGEIGPEDFGLLKDNFGRDGGQVGLAGVPEPASLAACLLGALGIRRRQSR